MVLVVLVVLLWVTVVASLVPSVMVTTTPANPVSMSSTSATTMVLTTVMAFLVMNRRRRRRWARVRVLGWGIVGSARIMWIWLAVNWRHLLVVVALPNRCPHMRMLRDTTVTVTASTSVVRVMPLLGRAPMRGGRLGRSLVRVAVLLRRPVGRLLGVLGGGI